MVKAKVKKWNKVPLEVSMHIRVLHQEFGWKVCDMQKKFKTIPRRTLSYHANIKLNENKIDKRKYNKGRPSKLSERDRRKIKRCIEAIRQYEQDPNFSIGRVQVMCGLETQCSTRTVNRAVQDMGYHYLNTRQKGLMSKKDHSIRVEFARKCAETVGPDLWLSKVSMYYDGVAFYHKKNPFDQAISPKKKIWRKRSEGLKMTAKGKKEGNNGKRVKLYVGISHGKGVVMCDQWDNDIKYNGESYKQFVIDNFPKVWKKCSNGRKKIVLQDGDPVQTSQQAYLGYKKVGCKIFSIPARSPDINPIENIFHLVRRKMAQEAIDRHIVSESYEVFAARVKHTIESMPIDVIDRTLESMAGRMQDIIDCKGIRIKY